MSQLGTYIKYDKNKKVVELDFDDYDGSWLLPDMKMNYKDVYDNNPFKLLFDMIEHIKSEVTQYMIDIVKAKRINKIPEEIWPHRDYYKTKQSILDHYDYILRHFTFNPNNVNGSLTEDDCEMCVNTISISDKLGIRTNPLKGGIPVNTTYGLILLLGGDDYKKLDADKIFRDYFTNFIPKRFHTELIHSRNGIKFKDTEIRYEHVEQAMIWLKNNDSERFIHIIEPYLRNSHI